MAEKVEEPSKHQQLVWHVRAAISEMEVIEIHVQRAQENLKHILASALCYGPNS